MIKASYCVKLIIKLLNMIMDIEFLLKIINFSIVLYVASSNGLAFSMVDALCFFLAILLKLFGLRCSMWWARQTNQNFSWWMSSINPNSTSYSGMYESLRTGITWTRGTNCYLQRKQSMLWWYADTVLQVSLFTHW